MQSTDEFARLKAIGLRGDAADVPAGKRLARVIAQHRNGYRVHDGATEFAAQPAPRFLRRDVDPAERPAVGDFVVLTHAAPPTTLNIANRR